MKYLGCTELSSLSVEEQRTKAYILSVAALLGKDVYNFGELLAHPGLNEFKSFGALFKEVVKLFSKIGSLKTYVLAFDFILYNAMFTTTARYFTLDQKKLFKKSLPL